MDENDYTVANIAPLQFGDGEQGSGYGDSRIMHTGNLNQYGDGNCNDGQGNGGLALNWL
jgi:hypothetical protein